MRIKVEGGLIYDEKGRDLNCIWADKVARANGFIYAEHFVKKHEGATIWIDDKTLKIIGHVVVRVEGGVAEVVMNTAGVPVVIIDYDTDGVPDEDLCKCNLAGADAPHIHRQEGGAPCPKKKR
jgi:hypothetical protein